MLSKTLVLVKDLRSLPRGDSQEAWHRCRDRSPNELALGPKQLLNLYLKSNETVKREIESNE